MRYMVVTLEVSQFGYVRVEIRQLIEEVAHVGEGGGSGSGGGGGVPTDELIAASAPREGYRPMLELGGTSADAR